MLAASTLITMGLAGTFLLPLLPDSLEVQASGSLERVEVSPRTVHRCRGAGVLIPGPPHF